MGFVKEKVSEKDWEKYNSFDLNYGEKIVANKYKWWIADKEKNIYFTILGGGAFERPITYALIWEKEKILIDIESKVVYHSDSIERLHYYVNRIVAPMSLREKKNELKELIREVCCFDKKDTFSLDFLSEPIFLD